MLDVSKLTRDCTEDIITDCGCELVDVTYGREEGLMCLTLYVWSPDGVSLSKCEEITRAVEEQVEKADPTGGKPYCLCVSSPGERPLKTRRDFERNIGQEVAVELKTPIKGKKKKYTGTLTAYKEDCIVIDGKDGEVTLPIDNTESVKPYFGFNK